MKNDFQNKRIKVYEAIYGSDIFNQLPPKRIERIKYNYYDDNYNDIKNNKCFKNNIDKYIKKPKHFHKNCSSQNIFKSNNQYNLNDCVLKEEKYYNLKLNDIKELSQQYYSRRNKIESLKSNIFNDKIKEKQNKKIDNSYKIILHNDWNTNLDWRNAKSELIFFNENQYPQYDNSSNNRISKTKRDKIINFYKKLK
jgi:hypothetical protein